MNFPRRTNSFLKIELWKWKCHKNIQVLVAVNLRLIVIQVVVLFSSVLTNGADVYTSRMMLLLASVSASDLTICSSWLTRRFVCYSLLTQCLFVGWDDFASTKGCWRSKYVLLVIIFITTSCLIESLISVERRD
jgi:hypothetical protein